MALVPTKHADSTAFFDGINNLVAQGTYLRQLYYDNKISLGSFYKGFDRIEWLVVTWWDHRAEIEAGTFGLLQLTMLEHRKLIDEAKAGRQVQVQV